MDHEQNDNWFNYKIVCEQMAINFAEREEVLLYFSYFYKSVQGRIFSQSLQVYMAIGKIRAVYVCMVPIKKLVCSSNFTMQ